MALDKWFYDDYEISSTKKSLLWYDYLEKQRSQEQTQFLAGLSSLITELGAEESEEQSESF